MTQTSEVTFGSLLCRWRQASGMSQLQLAGRAGVSQRHVSFLESGRANPSRVMIFALSEALAVPLRDRNDLLLAAGFAPTYRRTSLEAPEMAPVREALARILVAHEPYPAIVFDRLYDIVQANRAARRLIAFLFAERAPDPTIAGNVLRSVLHPQGCRGAMENWDDLAAILLAGDCAPKRWRLRPTIRCGRCLRKSPAMTAFRRTGGAGPISIGASPC